MKYRRMPIEIESPEQLGYDRIKCNLTESSMPDMKAGFLDVDMAGLLLCYTDHTGDPALREIIASEHEAFTPDDVIVTVGAAAALFIVATSLLEPSDHIVVARPNYATNIETPRAIGCGMSLLELEFDSGFRIDTDRLRALITPRTRLISLTSPHNPTGAVMPQDQLIEIAAIAQSHGAFLLVDETYRDMAFSDPIPWAATLGPGVISVSSLSKTYGMPGIRTGWILCRNPELQELFLAAKEQIFICNSVVDEFLALNLLRRKKETLVQVKKYLETAFGIVRDWMNGQDILEWVEPRGGVVCFPRIKAGADVDVDAFYKILNEEYGTYVGPGHWFEMDRRYMRIGFGWPRREELEQGLANISLALQKARRG